MTVSARLHRIRRVGRRLLRRTPLEAVVWIGGLLALAVMDPRGDHLFSLCPLDALGLSVCPGCGLGHAVAFLARGEWAASLRAHPLGGPAVLLLSARVVRLVRHARRVDTTCSSPQSSTSPYHVERD